MSPLERLATDQESSVGKNSNTAEMGLATDGGRRTSELSNRKKISVDDDTINRRQHEQDNSNGRFGGPTLHTVTVDVEPLPQSARDEGDSSSENEDIPGRRHRLRRSDACYNIAELTEWSAEKVRSSSSSQLNSSDTSDSIRSRQSSAPRESPVTVAPKARTISRQNAQDEDQFLDDEPELRLDELELSKEVERVLRNLDSVVDDYDEVCYNPLHLSTTNPRFTHL
jgi:hypothetical protein